MDAAVNRLIKNLELQQGATQGAIDNLETEFQIKFPSDYRDFLLNSNGAEGTVGRSYLVIFSLEEMEEINKLSTIDEEIPGLILFGSNGGGESYAFDIRQSKLSFVEFPAIGLSPENIKFCGYTFHDFLKYIFNLYSDKAK